MQSWSAGYPYKSTAHSFGPLDWRQPPHQSLTFYKSLFTSTLWKTRASLWKRQAQRARSPPQMWKKTVVSRTVDNANFFPQVIHSTLNAGALMFRAIPTLSPLSPWPTTKTIRDLSFLDDLEPRSNSGKNQDDRIGIPLHDQSYGPAASGLNGNAARIPCSVFL